MKSLIVLMFFCSILNSQTVQDSYTKIVRDLNTLSINELQTADINKLEIQRDDATILLRGGTVYLLSSINNSTHALLYTGNGIFSCNPPTDVERKQLLRFTEKESVNIDFETLFLLFTDSTFDELSKKVTFKPSDISRSLKNKLKQALHFIKYSDETGFELDILRPFLFNDNKDFFYAHFASSGNDSYFFEIDPYKSEDILISKTSSQHEKAFRESICSYRSRRNGRVEMLLDSYDIKSYTIKSNVDKKYLGFSSQCSIELIGKTENRRWIPFFLYPDLSIDSVLINGKKTSYFQTDDHPIRWISSPESFSTSTTTNITMFYKGDLIKNLGGVYFVKSSLWWYPTSLEERKYSLFDLTFQIPSDLQLISIGENKGLHTNGDFTTSQWILNTPNRNASFIIGKFNTQNVSIDSVPPITVYGVSTFGNDSKIEEASKRVANSIGMSFLFFQNIYGRVNVNRFSAVEIFSNHGQAFPGVIHLPNGIFRASELMEGMSEVFCAHEVAHQWWGVGVDFKTYHDQWLSEAFAEYSGLWYLQSALKSNEAFYKLLETYKKSILGNRKYLFGIGNGQEAGPIWLGGRTSSSSTPNDYQLIIYRKGAWVLHMLRIMSLDLQTMNDDIFQETMKDFYTTYTGKQAGTRDFQNIVEKHFGLNMNWFFKQWIYNIEIPTYNITYYLEDQNNGSYKVKCVVKQSNVPDDFQMSIPFLIDFGNNKFARIKHLIKGPTTEFYFPELPLKPQSIKFNHLEAVLCEIDDEDWD